MHAQQAGPHVCFVVPWSWSIFFVVVELVSVRGLELT